MTKSVLIVGAGVLGQATGKGLIARGFEVAFADVDAAVVRRLRLEGYGAKEVREIEAPAADVYMLAVPTYTLDRQNDGIGCIVSASAHVGTWLSRQSGYGLVVVRSTVLPGTTEETILPILEETSGKRAGRDFGVCVNPEYLRERRAEEDFANPWLTLIGEYDQRSGDVLQEIMSWAKCPLHRASLREAEMQKFVHNLCNASKISFFNEMREVCKAEGLNSERVLALVSQSAEAVWNPRYGTRDLGPFGGSCLPKDSQAFLSWARRRLLETPVLEATIKLNEGLQGRQRVDSNPVRLGAPSREG